MSNNKPEVQVTVTPATSATHRDVPPTPEVAPTVSDETASIKEWMDADPVSAIRKIVAAAKAPYMADPEACIASLEAVLAPYPEHKSLVLELLSQYTTVQPNATAATPLVATRKAYTYKNVTEIALQIPELGIVIPSGGYSAPLMEETATLKVFYNAGMLYKDEATITNVPNQGNTAVVQGNQSSEMIGKQATVVGGPRSSADLAAINPATKPGIHMLEIRKSKPEELIKSYEGKSGVKDAITRSVVAIRDGSNPNPYGEIPSDAMSSILKVQGKEFATEVNSGQYIEDEAQKIISNATAAAGMPRAAAVVQDPNAPADIKPWLGMTGIQKKISIYKTSDAAVLTNLRNYERDANVISCLDTRLSEIAAGK